MMFAEGYLTYDYAKFIFRGPRDLLQQKLATLEKAHAEYCKEMDIPKTQHFTVGPPPSPTLACYIYETWGIQSNFINRLPGPFARDLTRADVRVSDSNVTGTDINTIGIMFYMGGTGLTVSLMNKKPAQKTQKRDSGGVGFYLGSRKSQLWGKLYKRGYEPTAMECSVTGKLLSRIVQSSKEKWPNAWNAAPINVWLEIKERAWAVWAMRWNNQLSKLATGELFDQFRVPTRLHTDSTIADCDDMAHDDRADDDAVTHSPRLEIAPDEPKQGELWE